MSTDQWLEDWKAGAAYLWRLAQEQYVPAVQANPKAYEPQVRAFIQDLEVARAHLDRMKAALPVTREYARFNRLAVQHYELSARFYPDTRPANQANLGWAALLIVLGLAVGVAATAWAAAAWQHARGLREQTAVVARELDARVQASREGRTLPLSTLPPAPPGKPAGSSLGKLLLGGLALVAGVMIVPELLQKGDAGGKYHG